MELKICKNKYPLVEGIYHQKRFHKSDELYLLFNQKVFLFFFGTLIIKKFDVLVD